MNITVYLGANEGNCDIYKEAVVELGKWIGGSGNTLIYGGSKSGLMGKLAEAVLNTKGKVIGVEPGFFVDAGFVYEDIDKLYITKDMSERKKKMIELADVFIAFPGGTGTLEELSEVISKLSLQHIDKACIIYNLNGYYNPLRDLLYSMVDTGFSSKERLEKVFFAENLKEVEKIINCFN